MLHGNLPVKLWGEVMLATSFILNLCPLKSVDFKCPEEAWQTLALKSQDSTLPFSRLRPIGCMAYIIPPGHRDKLKSRSIQAVMIGYEKNSNSYRLWNPKEGRVMISNNVSFDESRFPLSESPNTDTEELSIFNDDSYDKIWDSTSRVASEGTHCQSGEHDHSPTPPTTPP